MVDAGHLKDDASVDTTIKQHLQSSNCQNDDDSIISDDVPSFYGDVNAPKMTAGCEAHGCLSCVNSALVGKEVEGCSSDGLKATQRGDVVSTKPTKSSKDGNCDRTAGLKKPLLFIFLNDMDDNLDGYGDKRWEVSTPNSEHLNDNIEDEIKDDSISEFECKKSINFTRSPVESVVHLSFPDSHKQQRHTPITDPYTEDGLDSTRSLTK